MSLTFGYFTRRKGIRIGDLCNRFPTYESLCKFLAERNVEPPGNEIKERFWPSSGSIVELIATGAWSTSTPARPNTAPLDGIHMDTVNGKAIAQAGTFAKAREPSWRAKATPAVEEPRQKPKPKKRVKRAPKKKTD